MSINWSMLLSKIGTTTWWDTSIVQGEIKFRNTDTCYNVDEPWKILCLGGKS